MILHIQRYVHPVLGLWSRSCACGIHKRTKHIGSCFTQAIEPGLDRVRVLMIFWWHIPEERMLQEYNIFRCNSITPQCGRMYASWIAIYMTHLVPWNVTELVNARAAGRRLYVGVDPIRSPESGDKVIGRAEHGSSQANVLPLLSFTKET